MYYTAQVLPIPDVHFHSRRRVVNFAALTRQLGVAATEVRAADVTSRSCILLRGRDLTPDTAVWLKFSGVMALRARIVWIRGDKAFCIFTDSLDVAQLQAATWGAERPVLFGAAQAARG